MAVKVLVGREVGAEGLATRDQCVRDDSNCLRYSNRFKLATDTKDTIGLLLHVATVDINRMQIQLVKLPQPAE